MDANRTRVPGVHVVYVKVDGGISELEMEQERENEASLQNVRTSSWVVTAPPASLSQSALLCGMPVLYQQSSISSLLFVATPQHSRGDNSLEAGRFKKNSLSIPTQLLMPDGGIALGMPPSSLVAGSGIGGAGAAGRGEGNTEESRMSALRSSELAVLLSESPESQIRSRRSRLLLLLAILLSLQYISVFAILQGKDAPPIFLPRVLGKQVIWQNVHRAQLVLIGPSHHYDVLRHNFYIVALCLCLLLPLLLFVAVVEQKRQMEATQSPDGLRQRYRSPIPPAALCVAVVVFTSLMLIHSIFVVRTYFDIVVFFLFFAIRYTLNRLNFTCFSPHLLLTKAGNNL